MACIIMYRRADASRSGEAPRPFKPFQKPGLRRYVNNSLWWHRAWLLNKRVECPATLPWVCRSDSIR